MGMDTPENKGNTPLIIATRAKQENIVDVLLSKAQIAIRRINLGNGAGCCGR
jgi:ankyrin repeat protein